MMNRFSKKIVSLVIGLNVFFTAAVLYCFVLVGTEPTALIAAWFAFTTGELWLLAGIHKEKLRKGCDVRGAGFESASPGSPEKSGTAYQEG